MIPEAHKKNFDSLIDAFGDKSICLLECRDAQTGQPVYAICAVNQVQDKLDLVPFARMFDGNPFDELLAPDLPD